VKISFIVEVPVYGGAKPRQLRLDAEVVRVRSADTGLRLVGITTEQKRAVRAIVHEQQNLLASHRALRHGSLRVEAS